MRHLGKYLRYLLWGINVFFAIFLIFSAFSPYINPIYHPILSCAGMTFPAFLIINLLFLLFWLIVFRKYVLFPLIVFIICINQIRAYIPFNIPNKEIPCDAFKLLSYNVMAFANDERHTDDNPNPVLEYILNSNADIICLQEFIMGKDKYHLQKKDIDNALKDYPYKTYLQIGSNENGLACYSRYPILSQKLLPYESMYNGSAMYQLNINGDTVVILNNHLESNKLTYEDKKVYVDMIKSPKKNKVEHGARLILSKLAEAMAIRARQTQLISHIVDSLKVKGRDIIVCGDFNDTPISYTHRIISENLRDAFVQSGNGIGISYNQNGFYFRIDNILLSKNLRSYNCTVDNSIKDSDHYPIWCYIAKEKEN